MSSTATGCRSDVSRPAEPMARKHATHIHGGMVRRARAQTGPAIPSPHGRVRLERSGAFRRPSQTLRSAINCLIAPIALPGLIPFGQVLVQFMIVWQR